MAMDQMYTDALKELEQVKVQRDALAAALIMRKVWRICTDCGADIEDGDNHAESCPHFAAEEVARRLMEGE